MAGLKMRYTHKISVLVLVLAKTINDSAKLNHSCKLYSTH